MCLSPALAMEKPSRSYADVEIVNIRVSLLSLSRVSALTSLARTLTANVSFT